MAEGEIKTTNSPAGALLILGFILVGFNSLAFATLMKCSRMCQQVRLLAMNLTITDLGMGCVYLYAFVLRMTPALSTHCFCNQLLFLFSSLLITVSTLTVTLMALDRFLSMYLALKYVLVALPSRLKIVCTLTWVVGLIMNIVSFLKSNYRCTSTNIQGEDGRFVIMFLVCGIIVLVCYAGVLYYVLQHKKNQKPGENSLKSMPVFKPFLKVSIIVSAFVSFYLPLAVYLTIDLMYPDVAATLQSFYVGAVYTITFNSLVNPILYVWRFRECRLKMMTILCFWKKNKVHELNIIINENYAPFLEKPQPPNCIVHV